MFGFRSVTAPDPVRVPLGPQLRRSGLFNRQPGGRLVASRTDAPIHILGVVEAGWPSPAEEELLDTMSLDEYLAPNKDASYLLRVKGDSMMDAGIHPGDMVIVERTSQPRDGDIVIAEIDGEWTIKFLRKQGSRIWLEAASPNYDPIVPQRELKIVAVVRAVVRKY